MTPDPMDHLIRLIEEERQALLSGQYDLLEPLSRRKDTILDGIDFAQCDPADLATLQGETARNESLLKIALDAIREASADAQSVRDRFGRLETYGPAGERRSLSAPAAIAIRRA